MSTAMFASTPSGAELGAMGAAAAEDELLAAAGANAGDDVGAITCPAAIFFAASSVVSWSKITTNLSMHNLLW